MQEVFFDYKYSRSTIRPWERVKISKELALQTSTDIQYKTLP